MNDTTLAAHAQNLKSWMEMKKLPEAYPQFSYATLKHMFWKRDEKPGLNRCCRMIGKKLFINVPLFGLYLGGQLPEQQGVMTDD